ncbi:MAG: nitroreductase family protein [Papillibacter sp.]|jgi:nitroreductase|nr:nitroreductase family protein [Papillibacter sp.]
MNTLEAIRKRKATRGFTSDQISDEALEQLLVSGGLAAVGMAGFDSLRLFAIQNPELLKEIDAEASKGFGNPNYHALYGAPTLIVVAAKPRPLEYIELSDAGCIIQNMMLTATELGFDSIYLWTGMYAINRSPELMKKIGFPEGFTCAGTAAFGYALKPNDELREPVRRIESIIIK